MFFKHHLSEIINKKYNVYYERRNGHAKKHQSKQRLYVQRYYHKACCSTAGENLTVMYDGLLSKSGASHVYAHVGFDRDWKHVYDYQVVRQTYHRFWCCLCAASYFSGSAKIVVVSNM